MTEAEWLACEDPHEMLDWLAGGAGRVSGRKLQLFGVACCRSRWDLFACGVSRAAIEAADAFADGRATDADVTAARDRIECLRAAPPTGATLWDRRTYALGAAASLAKVTPGMWSARDASDGVCGLVAAASVPESVSDPAEADEAWQSALIGQAARHANFLRCLFGNPFRPVTAGPWVTPSAVAVSRDIYDRRDFAALPLLADLLEEAGCPEQSVLDHCRTPGEHARGCWAVDLVLGKG
jgi:hypothetical protein